MHACSCPVRPSLPHTHFSNKNFATPEARWLVADEIMITTLLARKSQHILLKAIANNDQLPWLHFCGGSTCMHGWLLNMHACIHTWWRCDPIQSDLSVERRKVWTAHVDMHKCSLFACDIQSLFCFCHVKRSPINPQYSSQSQVLVAWCAPPS